MDRKRTAFITITIATVVFVWVLNYLIKLPQTIPSRLPSRNTKYRVLTGPLEQSSLDNSLGHNCSELYTSRRLLTINFMGRIGNEFFQMAALLATARELCRTAVLPAKLFDDLNMFNISSAEFWPDSDPKKWPVFSEEFALTYSPEVFNLSESTHWRLAGYFQSWRYFATVEDYLRRVFIFKDDVLKNASQFLNTRIDSVCHLSSHLKVGIHVRRTDFLSNATIAHGGTVATVDYINKSMETFRKLWSNNELCFIVASDDKEWCKANVVGPNVYYSDLPSAGEDLALLSLCDHMIITTGSFGWLAAWLAGGKTIYYSQFPKPGSFLDNATTKDDYFLPNWLGLP